MLSHPYTETASAYRGQWFLLEGYKSILINMKSSKVKQNLNS